MAEGTLTLKITLGEAEHIFRYDDCTAVDYAECRKQTGLTLTRLLGMIEDGETDLDSIAVAVWLARRQAGERKLSFAAVAEKIGPMTPCTIDVVGPANGVDPVEVEDPE